MATQQPTLDTIMRQDPRDTLPDHYPAEADQLALDLQVARQALQRILYFCIGSGHYVPAGIARRALALTSERHPAWVGERP